MRPIGSRSATLGAWAGAALLLAGAGATSCTHEYRPYQSSEVAHGWELGGAKATVEVAKDRGSRERGLMFRTSMPADHGMVFVYPEPRVLRFWMRNTAIPLSIAFIEEVGEGQGRIVNVVDMQPFVERPEAVSHQKVRLALEMNQGWFERHGIKAGDAVALPSWVHEIVAGEDN